MVLLWNTMGASPLYQAFGGLIEVAGALLLFFRRTALLGALIVLGAMANVLALNLGYDVFVKHLTLHLIIGALAIVFVHRERLFAFFFRERAAAVPLPARMPFASRRFDLGFRVAGYALAVWLVASGVAETRAIAAANTAPLPSWSGIYEVTSFALDGHELPPMFGDHARWRRVTIYPGALVVDLADDQRELWLGPRDESAHNFSIQHDTRPTYSGPIPGEPSVVHYDERADGMLALDGMLGDRHLVAMLHRAHPTFRLERPTGHWIDDGTFQR